MLTRNIAFNLVLAGLILFAAAGGMFGLFSDEVSERATGILINLVMIIFANAMPKTESKSCLEPERSPDWRGVRMFAAWSLILGSLGYIAAWVFAPLDQAPFIAMVPMGAGVLAMAARFLIGPKKTAG
jgi:hypothetical protein